VLHFAELRGAFVVNRDTRKLLRGESDPLTEGEVQGDSVIAVVDLRGAEIRELAEPAIESHLPQRVTETQKAFESFRGVPDHAMEVQHASDVSLRLPPMLVSEVLVVQQRYEGHAGISFHGGHIVTIFLAW
jgi:hypothetical protein